MAEAEFRERQLKPSRYGGYSAYGKRINRDNPYIDTVINGKKTRVYGTQDQLDEFQNKKPDGTKKIPVETQTSIPKNEAKTPLKEEGAVTQIDETGKGDVQSSTPTTSGTAGVNLNSLVPNPLENFASINYLFTLAVLTPQQFNNPASYREAEGLSFGAQSFDVKSKFVDDDGAFGEKSTTLRSGVVFSSGGRGSDTERVTTAFGTPEYYLDDFEMKAVVAANVKTGNQNAIEFNFSIYEPYSMGLLLQSLQVAAIKAGYPNYLNAPFLLKLDFRGFSDSGKLVSSVKSKFFIFKLTDITFNVDESGSKYSCTGIPYNMQGFADTVDTMFANISIRPTSAEMSKELGDDTKVGSVKDILAKGPESLITYLNNQEKENVAAGKYLIPDEYEIHFPKDSSERLGSFSAASSADQGATINPEQPSQKTVGGAKSSSTSVNIGNNAIGDSDFGFDVGDGGNFPFKMDKDVVDDKTSRVIRDKMQIDETKREFHFTQKQKLTDIITQTILSSTFAKKATQEATSSDGFINWFKIDAQVEFLDYDTVAGDFAKRYIYRVVPFKVHASVFGNPSAVPVGYSELEKQIVKRYDYIYTGQNVDILDFEIALNYMFFTGTVPRKESNTKDEVNQDNKGTVEKTASKTETGKGADKSAQTATVGKSKIKKDPNSFSILQGGPGATNVEQRVAENFQNIFTTTSSSDLVEIDLKIMGDTFWLIDSGQNNYFAGKSETSSQLTEDGTMNYENSDVYIYISFRTPADINTVTGLVEFSVNEVESPFSGIYRVTECTNNFAKGQFTQTLKCIRMQGQPQDFEGKNKTIDKTNDKTTKIEGKEEPKTNITEPKLSSDGKRVVGGL